MRLGVIGAKGKMGEKIVTLASKDPAFKLISPLITYENQQIPPLDIIIDFSTKDALLQNLILAQKIRCPIVIGTTGFTQKEHDLIAKAALNIPIFWAPNFSIGIAAALQAAKLLSSLLQGFTVHIEETHHVHKKDAPSGSALALKMTVEKGNPHNTPTIESFRKDEVVGDHAVFFTAKDEKITLSHQAFSRDVFANGALTAAKFLITQKPGLYGMDNLLAK